MAQLVRADLLVDAGFLEHPPQVGPRRLRKHRLLSRRAGEHEPALGLVLQPEAERLAEGFGQRNRRSWSPSPITRTVHLPPHRPVVQLPFALRSARAQANSWIIHLTAPWIAVARVAFAGSPLPILDGGPGRPVGRAGVNR